jgi:hypothetical protein
MKTAPSCRRSRLASEDAHRRMDDALTELAAYALLMEVERNRVQQRFMELGAIESSAADRVDLMRQSSEMTEELEAFRVVLTALADEARAG